MGESNIFVHPSVFARDDGIHRLALETEMLPTIVGRRLALLPAGDSPAMRQHRRLAAAYAEEGVRADGGEWLFPTGSAAAPPQEAPGSEG